MLHFKPVNKENIVDLSKFFIYQDFRICDFSIGTIIMWSDYYSTEYAIVEKMLIFKIKNNDTIMFTIPIGAGTTEIT